MRLKKKTQQKNRGIYFHQLDTKHTLYVMTVYRTCIIIVMLRDMHRKKRVIKGQGVLFLYLGII